MHGKFWARIPNNHNSFDTVIVYAHTYSDGSAILDFVEDDPATIISSSNSQPQNLMVLGAGQTLSSVSKPTGCLQGAGKYYNPDTGEYFQPDTIFVNGDPISPDNPWPFSNSNRPPGPLSGLETTGTPGVRKGQKTTPTIYQREPQPVGVGFQWQDLNGNVRVWNGTAWEFVRGPRSGVFADKYFIVPTVPGKMAYETTADNTTGIADNTDLACYGRVVGITTETRLAYQPCVVQSSGFLPMSHTFATGSALYLSTIGDLTETPPAFGSGYILQKVAVAAYQNGTLGIEIQIEEPIILEF
jgi:hypothetical protein